MPSDLHYVSYLVPIAIVRARFGGKSVLEFILGPAMDVGKEPQPSSSQFLQIEGRHVGETDSSLPCCLFLIQLFLTGPVAALQHAGHFANPNLQGLVQFAVSA